MNLKWKVIKPLNFKHRLKNKFKEWRRRFLLAEICGAVHAVVAAYLAHHLSHNEVVGACAGAIGDTVGLYAHYCTGCCCTT